MATPPTFSAGAVLTAAQMNAVGLWEIKSETIGNAVATYSPGTVFSSDFDAYKIIITGGTASATGDIRMQIGGATTGYYTGLSGVTWSTGTAAVAARNNTVAYMDYVGAMRSTGLFMDFDLLNPYLAKPTVGSGTLWANNASYFTASVLENTTSYTTFTLTPSTGTWTGGTVRVYGYRN